MKRKLFLVALIVLFVGACSMQIGLKPGETPVTPTTAFKEASTAYINAWESYHKVWAALPAEDPRKKEWVRKFHPKFHQAAGYLEIWGEHMTDPAQAVGWDSILSACEDVLLELMIKKTTADK